MHIYSRGSAPTIDDGQRTLRPDFRIGKDESLIDAMQAYVERHCVTVEHDDGHGDYQTCDVPQLDVLGLTVEFELPNMIPTGGRGHDDDGGLRFNVKGCLADETPWELGVLATLVSVRTDIGDDRVVAVYEIEQVWT